MKLTQKYLKEILTYNQETGMFKWNISISSVKVGDKAGYTHSIGYVIITINKKQILAHRLAWLYMNGSYPSKYIDHINHIKTDNRWCNLREVTTAENNRNMPLSKRNKSGTIGVHFIKDRNRWRASIMINRKRIGLGNFTNKECAIKARKKASIKYGFHENHGNILGAL